MMDKKVMRVIRKYIRENDSLLRSMIHRNQHPQALQMIENNIEGYDKMPNKLYIEYKGYMMKVLARHDCYKPY